MYLLSLLVMGLVKLDLKPKDPFALDNSDVFFRCFHVRTVTLVTMQPISDDINNYAENIKNLYHCRQVRTDPKQGNRC